MKKFLSVILVSVSVSAFATPVLYDGFDYPTSPTNLTANASWADAANPASITNRPYVVSGSLSYSGLYPSIGNMVHLGNKGMSARRAISKSDGTSFTTGDTVYYSLILKVTDIGSLPTGTGGIFFVAFNGGTFVGTQEPSIIASGLLAKKVDATKFVLGVKKAGGGATFSGNSGGPTTEITNNVGDVVFVVLSYQFVTGPGAGNGDVAKLWVNPSSGTFGAASPPLETVLSAPASADIANAINGITLYNRQAVFEPGAIEVDELNVGTAWVDVTPTTSTVTMAFTTQPTSQRVLVGKSATFNSAGYRNTTYQWQKNGSNIPGATGKSYTVSGAKLTDAGSYTVVIGNGVNTPLTSNPAILTVSQDQYARLVPLWNIPPSSGWGGAGPGTRPYLTVEPSTQPGARHFALDTANNRILVTSHTNTSTLSSAGMIYVLNADTGADLYSMDTSGITGVGLSTTNGNISLNAINVADDGAVYASNSGQGSGTPFQVYRWADSSSGSSATKIWEGDPFSLSQRWGDAMGIRGSGAGTEILLDDSTGVYGSLLQNPTSIGTCTAAPFTNVVVGSTLGRLLRFGDTNTFWEKHGGNLHYLKYDTAGFTTTSLTNYPFPSALSTSDFSQPMNLLAGMNFASSSSVPDTVDLYEMSDPSQPMYLASYSLPVNHNANGNGCGRVIWADQRVYALDANNGMMAFTVVPFLSIAPSGTDVVLSWPATFTGYTLQASPALTTAYTNVSTGTLSGGNYTYTASASAATLFYRLKKP